MTQKINSIKDLEAIKNNGSSIQARINSKIQQQLGNTDYQIAICMGGSCLASGAKELSDSLKNSLQEAGLQNKCAVVETGCMGPCSVGPVLMILPDRVFYQGVKKEDAKEIVLQHISKGKVVERLLRADEATNKPIPSADDIAFFRKQQKIVLGNCGIIDPLSINDYIAVDGYFALASCLTSRNSQDIITTIIKSGLRGRGGGGFPTGKKWEFTKNAQGTDKVVVCNADEGDPGAFMDRSVLEGDPHSVIEGMAIAGFAIGATCGYVYVRAEYPLAVERLSNAIEQARACGLLGNNILNTGFNFDLEIRMGSGAFVCGEETALLTSIEGNRGEPKPRPPFPATKGLWNKPTLLNNVETFANISHIIRNGADWYAAIGTEKSKGTKVFALAGAVKNTGLVEVPIGISLGELIYDVGGGIKGGKAFKAAQVGGPSGGCIPKEHLNVSLDYESLIELGAIMGSGGLIVMDEDTCMVDVARFFLEFVQEESCGKCVPCRVGTKRLLEILERICAGEGQDGDIERLIELGTQIKETALCNLGKTAANPVLSTIRHFRDEYEAHIRDKRCPAGVCPGLVRAPCQSGCPASVDVPGFVSLVGEKRYAEALRLHRERNPFAAACARVCFHTCEDRCRRSSLDEAVAIRGIKRFMVDQEVTVQLPEVRENEKCAGRKVAIIGAGPAGLSCAYFLSRLGYKPKVIEAELRPGGMMVQAIPAYRLPREILAREVRMIEGLGVDIETGKRLGVDFSIADLRNQGYEAVFIAVGAPESVKLDVLGASINGTTIDGVTEALTFLRQYNTKGSVPVGKQVVVCGGGNAAIDAARTAVRLGAEQVTILYRRTKEEMPAYAEEIEEAENEGVRIEVLVAPVEIVNKDGKVHAVKCQRMRLGAFDRSGRRRPEANDKDAFTIEADQVIAAISQSLDVSKICGDIPIGLRSNGYIGINPTTGQTSIEWLFAGGDCVLGPASVIDAVAHGERAAVGIDKYLNKEANESNAFWRKEKDLNTAFNPDAEPSEYAREKLPLVSVQRRKFNFDEVEQPWSESATIRQTQRCLRCDYGKKTHTF